MTWPGFVSPYTLFPVVGGLCAWAVLWVLSGRVERALQTEAGSNSRKTLAPIDYAVMVMMMAVGVAGFLLHVSVNLADTVQFSWVRMLYGTPILAPLGIAQLGVLGILVSLTEKTASHQS